LEFRAFRFFRVSPGFSVFSGFAGFQKREKVIEMESGPAATSLEQEISINIGLQSSFLPGAQLCTASGHL